MTLDQAQIFFYISVPICLIILTTFLIIRQFLLCLLIKKVINIVKEVENKIIFIKNIIQKIKEKLLDTEFFFKKIDQISEYISKFKTKKQKTKNKKRD